MDAKYIMQGIVFFRWKELGRFQRKSTAMKNLKQFDLSSSEYNKVRIIENNSRRIIAERERESGR
ncbi:MAG TPA: hypothetical protein ENK52_01035 [Saprospiraceae bacterium]|nr:hypothetical protein [Saprospiraceae bacterium]